MYNNVRIAKTVGCHYNAKNTRQCPCELEIRSPKQKWDMSEVGQNQTKELWLKYGALRWGFTSMGGLLCVDCSGWRTGSMVHAEFFLVLFLFCLFDWFGRYINLGRWNTFKCWSSLRTHTCPWCWDCWKQIRWTVSTPQSPSLSPGESAGLSWRWTPSRLTRCTRRKKSTV